VTTGAISPPARRGHRLYLLGGAAVFAVIFAGFARSYYLKALFGTPALPWLVHVHGFLMTSWFVLYFTQVRLVAAHRVDLHRRLGTIGAALAPLMVIVAFVVLRHAAARDARNPDYVGPPPLQFMGFLFFALTVFLGLVGAALLLRRRRDYHARLMLLSCLSMVGPGLARIPLDQVPPLAFLRTGGPFGAFGLDMLIVYACVGYDTWRNRRLHPAFVVGGLLLLCEDLHLIWLFLRSATWMHIATWITS